MKKHRLLILTALLVTLLPISVVGTVAAFGDLILNVPEAYYDGNAGVMPYTHPYAGSGNYFSAMGQTFEVESPTEFGDVQFYCTRVYTDSPTKNETYNAQLFNNTGNTLTAGPSTTSGFVSSTNTVSYTDVAYGGAKEWVNFTFPDNTLLLAGNYTVAMVCTFSNQTIGYSVSTCGTNTNIDSGRAYVYRYSTWYNGSGWNIEDMIIKGYEYVEPTPTPSPSPTPTASPTPTPAPTTYTGVTSYLIAFAVCIIPAIIGFLTVGPWGFLIGLNVGVALGIVSFSAYVPVWAGLLMAVMDVAALLTSGLGGKGDIPK